MPEKQMNCSWISINVERPHLEEFGLYCICATCKQIMSGFVQLTEDGTIEFSSHEGLLMRNLPHSKLVAVRTGEGNLSISCGHCRSGQTKIHVLPMPDGISSSRIRCGKCNDPLYPGHYSLICHKPGCIEPLDSIGE
jgi:hypothetical protein